MILKLKKKLKNWTKGLIKINLKEPLNFHIENLKNNKINIKKSRIRNILYTLRGAGFGKCAIADFSDGTVASSLVGIRCNDNLRAKFLIQWLNSSNAENEEDKAVNGSTAQNISVEHDIIQAG